MKCQSCGEREAEVDVDIPAPENGRTMYTLKLCTECAVENVQNGGKDEAGASPDRKKSAEKQDP